jgi:hypothetical protein
MYPDDAQDELTQQALEDLAQSGFAQQVDAGLAPLTAPAPRQPINLSLEDVGGPITGRQPINLSLEDVGGPITGHPMELSLDDVGGPIGREQGFSADAGSQPLPPGDYQIDPQHEADAYATGEGMDAQPEQAAMDAVRPAQTPTRPALVPRGSPPPSSAAEVGPGASGASPVRRAMARLSGATQGTTPKGGPSMEERLSSARDEDRARAVARAAIAFLAQAGARRPINQQGIARTGDRSSEQAVMGEMERARQAQVDLQRQQAQGNATEMQRQEAQRLADLRDPGSEASRQAQATLMAIDHTITPEEAAHMTGEQIDRMLPGATAGRARLQNTEQRGEQIDETAERKRNFIAEQNEANRRAAMERVQAQQAGAGQRTQASIDARLEMWRRRHSGGGGGGAQAMADLLPIARDAGIPEDAARHMRPRDLANLVARTAAQGAGQNARINATNARRGVVNGRQAILTDETGGIAVGSSNTGLSPHAVEEAQTGLAEARTMWAAMDQIHNAAQRAGAAGLADPSVAASLNGPRATLMGAIGAWNHFGVLSDSEKATIRASLEDPTSAQQFLLGTGPNTLEGWRQTIRDRLQAKLGSISVQGADLQRALDFVQTGRIARAPQAAPQGPAGGSATNGWVLLHRPGDPPGQNRRVAPDRADAARQAGWTDPR